MKLVNITVHIDGRIAIEEPFDVGDGRGLQHNWKTYCFRLDPGKHVLTAEAGRGRTTHERTFELAAKRWAVLSFWAPSETDTPHFSFEIRKEAPAFE